MRTFNALFWLAFASFFAACAKTEAPVFGTPELVGTPAVGNVAGPRFAQDSTGQLVLSWMARNESGATLKYSSLVDGEFSESRTAVIEPRMFVNWADLPSVTPLDVDHWVAHWLRYSADKTYSYDVVVAQSFDGGATWGESVTAHADGTPTEHGFVSLAPDADGAMLLWLDGRNTPHASMTLRSAVLRPDGQFTRKQEVDATVCDCCQTDIAVAADGPVAVYRDRTAEEIRDIYVTRFTGGRWQPGVRLFADNWVIPGCPVNGPSIIARHEHVAVAWFSAADDRPVIRVIRSTDSGHTFTNAVEVASGAIYGYVGLVSLDQGNLAVSWVAKTDSGDSMLRVRTISESGAAGQTQDVATIHQLRVFPQLAFADDHLWLAWTDEDADRHRLFAVRMPIETR